MIPQADRKEIIDAKVRDAEEMLPEPGYYFAADDAVPNENIDTLQLSIPASDRGFLADIARRMGWSTRKIAVL